MAKPGYEHLRTIFEEWWRGLNDSADDGARGGGANRADTARLRRVATFSTDLGPRVDVAAALTIGGFRDLHRRARLDGDLEQEERLVVAAVTLSHVRADAPGRQTAQLLAGPDPDRKIMSETRFLRLIRVRTPAALMDEGRRIAALLKTGAPVGDLGASLMIWLDDPDRRRLWAQAYYGLGARPSFSENPPQTHPESGHLQS